MKPISPADSNAGFHPSPMAIVGTIIVVSATMLTRWLPDNKCQVSFEVYAFEILVDCDPEQDSNYRFCNSPGAQTQSFVAGIDYSSRSHALGAVSAP